MDKRKETANSIPSQHRINRCSCGNLKFIDVIDELRETESGGEGYGRYIKCDVIKKPICINCYFKAE